MDLRRNIEKKLWLNISENYEEANYSNAILDSIHMLTENIKSKTGLELDGSRLIEQAFSGDIPKSRINKFQTEYEKNIQKGIQEILKGIYSYKRSKKKLCVNRYYEKSNNHLHFYMII
ncbi:MAG TPA: TIGR02391 family protein [Clostridium sp.]|nr:TIGR02391 family protein [Clostridium sp.]